MALCVKNAKSMWSLTQGGAAVTIVLTAFFLYMWMRRFQEIENQNVMGL